MSLSFRRALLVQCPGTARAVPSNHLMDTAKKCLFSVVGDGRSWFGGRRRFNGDHSKDEEQENMAAWLLGVNNLKIQPFHLPSLGGVNTNLIQMKMVDVNCKQLMSSYTGSTCKVMPTLAHGYNPDTVYPFNHFNDAIAEQKPLVTDYSDQFSFLKGLLDNGSMPVGPSLNTDSHTRQSSYEMLLSPERGSATAFSERGSTITSSSNSDGISEFGAFDNRSFFSRRDYFVSSEKDSFQHQYNQGVASIQNLAAMPFSSTLTEHSEFSDPTLQISGHSPQMVSGNSNFPGISVPKPHIFEQKQQPSLYEQFSKSLMDEAPSSFTGLRECCSSVDGKMDPMLTQHPSAKFNGVYVAPASSSHLSSSTIVPAPANSSIHLQISVAQKILCAYNSQKSFTGNCLESFV